MASLTTAREWGDVMTWLSLDTTWHQIFVGLASASPRLPHMCVENGASSRFANIMRAFACFFFVCVCYFFALDKHLRS